MREIWIGILSSLFFRGDIYLEQNDGTVRGKLALERFPPLFLYGSFFDRHCCLSKRAWQM